MINIIKNMLGGSESTDYKTLAERGAMIVDVRSKGEFDGGHVKGAVNVPLDTLPAQCAKWDKKTPIVTCCASGMRSASAKSVLQAKGFKEVYNGGGWTDLQRKLQ